MMPTLPNNTVAFHCSNEVTDVASICVHPLVLSERTGMWTIRVLIAL